MDLRDDRRSGDGETKRVAVNNCFLSVRQARQGESVNQEIIWFKWQRPNCPLQNQPTSRAEPESIDLGRRDLGDPDPLSDLTDDWSEPLASRCRQQLGVADTCERAKQCWTEPGQND